MYTFMHEYKGHKIKFTVSMMGKEALYVDEKLVSTSSKWVFTSCHQFTIDGEELSLELTVESMMTGELMVVIKSGESQIFSETQEFVGFGVSKTVQEPEARRWIESIAFPKDVFNYAWALYFAIIFLELGDWLIDDQALLQTALVITLSIFLCYSIFTIAKLTYNSLTNGILKQPDSPS